MRPSVIMSDDLRSKVIRLAHENPALRPHLLPLLKEAALRAGQPVRSDEDFDALKAGDRVTINGRAAVVLGYDKISNTLNYALEGKSVRKSLDAGLAMADKDETPEIEIEWKGKGAVPAGVRSAPGKRTPPQYD